MERRHFWVHLVMTPRGGSKPRRRLGWPNGQW